MFILIALLIRSKVSKREKIILERERKEQWKNENRSRVLTNYYLT